MNEVGKVTAPDGWRLEWDLREIPHSIDVYDAAGIKQLRVSGDIGPDRLWRALSFLDPVSHP